MRLLPAALTQPSMQKAAKKKSRVVISKSEPLRGVTMFEFTLKEIK